MADVIGTKPNISKQKGLLNILAVLIVLQVLAYADMAINKLHHLIENKQSTFDLPTTGQTTFCSTRTQGACRHKAQHPGSGFTLVTTEKIRIIRLTTLLNCADGFPVAKLLQALVSMTSGLRQNTQFQRHHCYMCCSIKFEALFLLR